MQIIVIAAQKGGAGKTTLALHLAVEYQRAGKSVALIDTDPQRSAEMWGGLRDAQDITVVGGTRRGNRRGSPRCGE
ncbi:UNVERIFIED_ORG: cellulose biosynthesis protein BcsQ [Xanthomonas axonopodis]